MGLTAESMGAGAAWEEHVSRQEGDITVALAGNPNVGKSTVFNGLTGLDRHTGNWTGKTVSAAEGICTVNGQRYIIADLPGTYSLLANSAEEELARDYICFEKPDAVIVVCDASCLERNLNLVLQIMEITPNVAVCVNLIDEAEKKGITVDGDKLERLLGVPVCMTAARDGKGLDRLIERIPEAVGKKAYAPPVIYPENVERAAEYISELLAPELKGRIPLRFAALRMLDSDSSMTASLKKHMGISASVIKKISAYASGVGCGVYRECRECSCCGERIRDMIVSSVVQRGAELASECVHTEKEKYYERDRKIDRVLTHRIWGVPVMLMILLLIFWITVSGANYPSAVLFSGFSWLGERISAALAAAEAPRWLSGILTDGIYSVLTWVISVMLPPMAIFFPLFTLMEDSGYLPRAAFNLDGYFRRSGSCGKQALTMAMGLGCNAAGITGCRIIDSPRERLIAILTNCFVPCNGKFPTLTAVISMFIAGLGAGVFSGLISAAVLTAVIAGGVIITLIISGILSKTLLKGESSSFTLELPSYRRPQIRKVIVRSLLDRTVFVLGRAVISAVPAGVLIWICANVTVGDSTLLQLCASALDPFGQFIGLDGVILLGFILGLPANEIVLPIILMAYTCSGTIVEYEELSSLKQLLVNNGWDISTAVCMIIFMVCHFPCATSVLTVKKETGSVKWAVLSMVIPTAVGIILCALTAAVFRIVS